ncbi:hypothetical protein B6U74_02790 [Candidatus Bathyarchaeota archaeon ex4484_205]|nr:MAG: hypothetical protein B6U74_02790 [Candidatus Bathyarchaeota archaeon ex4484_205]
MAKGMSMTPYLILAGVILLLCVGYVIYQTVTIRKEINVELEETWLDAGEYLVLNYTFNISPKPDKITFIYIGMYLNNSEPYINQTETVKYSTHIEKKFRVPFYSQNTPIVPGSNNLTVTIKWGGESFKRTLSYTINRITPIKSLEIFTDKREYLNGEDMNLTVKVESSITTGDDASIELRVYAVKRRIGTYYYTRTYPIERLQEGLNVFNYTFRLPYCSPCAGIDEGEHPVIVEIHYNELKVKSVEESIFIYSKK